MRKVEWMEKEIKSLKERNLFRIIRTLKSGSQTRVLTDDGEKLLFCSNNYLGLVMNEQVIAAAERALKEYGAGTGGSRLLFGANELHQLLETELAEFKNQESALLFGTGYMANVGIISALAGPEDLILSDELNHASIIDGCRLSKARVLVYRHNDTAHLEQLLKENNNYRTKLIVTDGVFSMDGDLAPLPEISLLCKKYGAYLIVDDAHGTGVLGPDGSGTAGEFGLKPEEVFIHMGTLSKALAAEGGFVATSQLVREYLVNKSRSFIFSTALPPAVIGAARQALKLIRTENWRRERLRKLSISIRKEIKGLGFDVLEGFTPIIPVLIGPAETTMQFSHALYQKGIIAPGVRPPTVPPGSSRIRITLMATHTDEDIETLLKGLFEAGKEVGVI